MANGLGASYSRYADDLTFSGNDRLPAIGDVRERLAAHGFQLAEAKSRRSKIGQSHYVTGLSASDPHQPHVARKMKHRLRQEMYYAGKFGLDGHFRHRGINDARVIQHEVQFEGLLLRSTKGALNGVYGRKAAAVIRRSAALASMKQLIRLFRKVRVFQAVEACFVH